MKRSREECHVCKLVRTYLLIAVPLLAMLGLSNDDTLDQANEISWFAGVYLIDFLAYGAGCALIAVVSYKGYKEFWRPRQAQKRLRKLIERASPD